MNKVLNVNYLTLILLLSIFSIVNAQFYTMQDEAPPPNDTLLAWLYNPCNQPLQVFAFDFISDGGINRNMLTVKEEYNTQEFKDAFEFFVRSFTIELPDCEGEIIESDMLSSTTEGLSVQLMAVSLAKTWGISDDLYEIVEAAQPNLDFRYAAFVQHHLGTDYFDYVLFRQVIDSTYHTGSGRTTMYLANYPNPPLEMVTKALQVLEEYSTSEYIGFRSFAIKKLTTIYQKGYEQVGPSIEALLNDENESVRATARREVSQQHHSNRLLEFQWEEEPVEE